jgi:hypothetical protein
VADSYTNIMLDIAQYLRYILHDVSGVGCTPVYTGRFLLVLF